MRRVVLALTLAISVGCSSEQRATPTAPTPSAGEISSAARTHLGELLGFMQGNSINRLTINWDAVRNEVFAAAAGAQTIADTLPAIRIAITRLGDGHSSYRSTAGTVIFVANRVCSGSGGPAAESVPATIGYVSVGAFSGTTAEAAAFANRVQDNIRAADRDNLIGWIVDLRGNGGGNMWPMVAGLGPIIGDGVLGFFISPMGAESSWQYRDGASWLNNAVALRVDVPYRLRRENPRVAVLIDSAVASSGEATTIAFKQRPNTRFFGLPTCGLSTANAPFTLSDGAVLNLTTSVMADRAKTPYGDRVTPDEFLSDRNELMSRVITWLQGG